MRISNDDMVAELSSRLEKEKSIKKKVLLKQAIESIKAL
jgi:hypothetical protein